MKLKCFIAVFTTILIATATYAQTTGILFGIKGGVNFSKLSNAKGGNATVLKDANSNLVGFNAGVIVDIVLSETSSLRTGLDFQSKGTKYENVLAKKGQLNPQFIELPVNYVLRKESGNNALFIGAGPYIAYGLSGNNKYSPLTEDAAQISEKITWGNEPPVALQPGNSRYLKRLDYGLNAIGGIEFGNKYAINLQYGYGLSPAKPGDIKYQHRNLSAGIALFL